MSLTRYKAFAKICAENGSGIGAADVIATPPDHTHSCGDEPGRRVSMMYEVNMTRVLECSKRAVEGVVACLGLVMPLGCGDADAIVKEGGDSESITQAVYAPILVMSINARIPGDSGEHSWPNRRPRIIDLVKWYQPHVIGFQELKTTPFNEVASALPEYWYYWVDRGDGERIAIFMRSDRLQPQEFSFRNVTNAQRDDSCGLTDDEDPKNRPIQYVLAYDPAANNSRYYYNTHYPSHNSCERHGMATIFASYVNGRSNPSTPVVAMGDFNDGVEPDGRENGSYARFLAATGLVSTYFAVRPQNANSAFRTSNGNYDKITRHGKMIDHILYSPWDTWVPNANVDRTLYTSSNAHISCQSVANGLCPNGSAASSLSLYSDHWAVWAYVNEL